MSYTNNLEWLSNDNVQLYGKSVVCAVVYSIARFGLTKTIFQPTGQYLLKQTQKKENGGQKKHENGVQKNNENNGKNGKESKFYSQLSKWNESCWKATIFGFLTVMEIIAVWGEPWLTNHHLYFKGCKELPCLLPRSQGVTNLYTVAIGFYMYALPALIYWEARRKDFWASFAHHVVTLALLVYSEWINLTRVGTVILLLHDIDDVWLELAKLCRYINMEAMMNILFGIFTIFWFFTRVFYFPYNIIRATWFDSLIEAREENINPQPHWTILNSFLIILWVLHIYWSYFILKVAIGALTGAAETDDIREDDHED